MNEHVNWQASQDFNQRADEIYKKFQNVESRIQAAVDEAGRKRSDVTLIAVTKYFPVSDALILYELGLRNFGENRDEEGAEKFSILPPDIEWHFQGQIQGRKIRSIAKWADHIHSLDSLEHARKFNSILEASQENLNFFLQVNLEPSRVDRGGVAPEQLEQFLEAVGEYPHLTISGLMTVLPLEMDLDEGFASLAQWRDRLGLSQLSMGMSSDFESAIRAGATHIRVGSSILGSRPTLA